ncbi:hypothetical protein EVG20_g11463 [Dentipellis fragilis]|uniref:Uncharacterized protein n=1 Tax=Dentipellis fragilis TaxID=205917 RepID=A0A4Y9XMW8_9AGAM|nr:hypothetical protein EVG20_g11463 [Dentipellis fragilis]
MHLHRLQVAQRAHERMPVVLARVCHVLAQRTDRVCQVGAHAEHRVHQGADSTLVRAAVHLCFVNLDEVLVCKCRGADRMDVGLAESLENVGDVALLRELERTCLAISADFHAEDHVELSQVLIHL